MPFHRIFRMGCGVSKIDSNGAATPNRSILPNFNTRKKQPNKSIPSKKESLLLMPENNDDRPSISKTKFYDNSNGLTSEVSNKKDDDEKRVARIKTMVEEAEKNDEGEEKEEDNNDDDDQRAIKKVHVNEQDDNAFPNSPSFRVYFTDKEVETKKKNDCFNKVDLKDDVTPVAANTILPTKDLESSMEKEEKKEIRKRSTFRNVLPKNLLNGRSSSTSHSPTRSSYHHKVAS
ncbi:putative pyruvate dehydrogenase E1 component subunit beta, mitochondrial-like [Capsicum annuum]|uniref:flap endonuclease 1-like n=1 Tax=Capsicum annuum TaxID=4072 RepID=UPI0007BEE8CA|nr:flap endonuclease 1-like [Capsicum annuum]KAF3644098.1 putative pyruvate dehydrogenase E1 component subunit beta, mitochondrial-like [Capsicum annuum]